jgi:hypothetical protein
VQAAMQGYGLSGGGGGDPYGGGFD